MNEENNDLDFIPRIQIVWRFQSQSSDVVKKKHLDFSLFSWSYCGPYPLPYMNNMHPSAIKNIYSTLKLKSIWHFSYWIYCF